jgi:hypothetical protein
MAQDQAFPLIFRMVYHSCQKLNVQFSLGKADSRITRIQFRHFDSCLTLTHLSLSDDYAPNASFVAKHPHDAKQE